MDGAETDNDGRFGRLSLIDFASEDDFLLSSPSCDLHDVQSLVITKEDEEQNDLKQLETVDSCRIEDSTDTLEQMELEPQLLPSFEPERIRKNGKYNLRKSLAWDSAFFTSAGFLDPEELTSMIERVGKNEKHVLPSISEDIQKSSDSISTLESEIMPSESIEGNLFEDVRASIQKSSRIVGRINSRSKAESVRQETQKQPSPRRFDVTPQNKIKDGSTSNKQTDGLQGPGRTVKQNSSHPRGGQPLKAVGKLPSNSALTKRPSLGHSLPPIENDSTTSGGAGRGASVSLRNTTHKLTRSSTAAKGEQTTSSEVSASSSDNVGKSSSKDVRRKIEGKASPSSGGINKTQTRVASRVKTPIGNSRFSSHLVSQTKHSSGISPASSISEWSTESNSSRASLHSISSKRISIDSDASHNGRNSPVGRSTKTTGLLSQSVKKTSSQSSILPPASTKPSGLRLPSPKIGYFDGAKTSSMKSNLAVPGGLTKIGVGNVSLSGGQKSAKPSRLQPSRVLPKSTTRANIQPSMNLKSHKPGATRMSKINELDQPSTNLKSHKPGATRMSKINELDRETKELGSEGSNIDLHDSDISTESNWNSGALREKMSQENEAGCNADGEPNRSPNFQVKC